MELAGHWTALSGLHTVITRSRRATPRHESERLPNPVRRLVPPWSELARAARYDDVALKHVAARRCTPHGHTAARPCGSDGLLADGDVAERPEPFARGAAARGGAAAAGVAASRGRLGRACQEQCGPEGSARRPQHAARWRVGGGRASRRWRFPGPAHCIQQRSEVCSFGRHPQPCQ